MSLTTNSLVSTKLRPSQARPASVARPRLIAKLERETGRKLTLISAPAGFGKTTLLVEWLKGREDGDRSVAWVSLDEGDNDPVRFLSYLVAALRKTVGEGFGEGVLAALRSPGLPRMEAVPGALINELADLPGEVGVVLDDYHVIDSEAVHEVVSFLLEHLPPNLHLIISSRIDPPLPLVRLRARNQMAEFDAADLSFAPEEAATFLNSVMALNLSGEAIATLEERTEGWIAGLQLAALSMRDRKDVSGFIRSFSGSHRDVLDYLAEEVLERQAGQVRAFLLETSIAEHLSGTLCDAITGRDDGQEMLERLERENLFVFALDDERRWYRYHHLFAEFLRGRLMRERPESAGELHLGASCWYKDNGHLAEAIGHALSAPDHDLASRLIEEGVEDAVERGEGTTALRWLEALPTEAQAPEAPAVRRARGGPGYHRPSGRRRTPPERSRAGRREVDGRGPAGFCWGSPRPSGPGAPASGGTRPEAVELARRGLSLPARGQRCTVSQLRRRPPGGRAQERRRSGGGGRGLRGGRRDRAGPRDHTYGSARGPW